MPASDRVLACEPSDSLWAQAERRGVPGLDNLIVREPTTGEVEMLRERADEAERKSPFVDDVPAETLRHPLR